MASQQSAQGALPPVDIKPLLAKMWPVKTVVTGDDIAEALAHFFTNQVTEAQMASLLMALHFTQLDFKAEVLAKCAGSLQAACAQIPVKEISDVIERRGRKEGNYRGGLVSFSSPSSPSSS